MYMSGNYHGNVEELNRLKWGNPVVVILARLHFICGFTLEEINTSVG